MMYDIKNIDIGLTTRCNAGCPQCARTDPSTNKAHSFMKMEELYLDDIKRIIPPDLCKNIERFSLCGGYGDPLVARDILEILEYFYKHSPNATMFIATNGSMKKPISWWYKLGKILKDKDCEITFGIDGINQEMHSKYRVHTDLDLIFRNVEIMQLHKIRTRWQYLVFDYNKEYVEKAKEMSKQKGFDDFMVITSTRPAVGDFKPPEYDIIATSRDRNYNYFTDKKFNTIDCLSVRMQEVHITASGMAVPCCYIDDRFTVHRYLENYLKMYNVSWEDVPKDNYYRQDIDYLYTGVDLDRFDSKKHGLLKVLEDPWWDTFFEYQQEFKIHKCNDVCGKLNAFLP
jgi:sulfatase maturation enzyme AslB (radical SAM superfamily)